MTLLTSSMLLWTTTLIRKSTIIYGNGGAWRKSAGVGKTGESEWEVEEVSFEGLGVHEFEVTEAGFCNLFPGGFFFFFFNFFYY